MGWAADTFGPELLVKTADGAITKVDTDAHVAGKKLLALYFSAHVRSGMRCIHACGRGRWNLHVRTSWASTALGYTEN